VTHLEDSLRDYYSTKADQLVLPARVLDSVAPSDDASVSYISIGPEPRRRTPMLLAAAASIALIAGADVLVSRSGDKERGPLLVSNATVTTAALPQVVVCTISDSASGNRVTEIVCSRLTDPPLWPTDTPTGLSLSKIDESVGNNGTSRWHVLHYTRAGADGVAGEIRVVVETGASTDSTGSISFPDSDTNSSLTISVREIFLRGTRASVAQELTGKNPAIALSWRERPDLYVRIDANSASIEELTRIAEGLVPSTPGIVARL
jgi:hypothetical protein